MLLTISTTYQPATELGYLLHKNPARLQTFDLNFGQAHVFYPEATEQRCTAALLLDVDAVSNMLPLGPPRAAPWDSPLPRLSKPESMESTLTRCWPPISGSSSWPSAMSTPIASIAGPSIVWMISSWLRSISWPPREPFT